MVGWMVLQVYQTQAMVLLNATQLLSSTATCLALCTGTNTEPHQHTPYRIDQKLELFCLETTGACMQVPGLCYSQGE